jgi:hypothetical protein
MRNYSTIRFIEKGESIYNENFKPLGFERFKSEAGGNSFMLLQV